MVAGAIGPDGHLHARQDPDAEDQSHPDLPGPLVAEDPRVGRHGPVRFHTLCSAVLHPPSV